LTAVLFLLVPLAVLPVTYDNYLVKYLLISVFVFAEVSRRFLKKERLAFSPQRISVCIFVLFLFLSLFAAKNFWVSLVQLSKIIPVFLLCFLIGRGEKKRILSALSAAVLVVSVVGIFQFFYFLLIDRGSFGNRIYSTLGNPNFLSSFLIVSFPFFVNWAERKSAPALAILPYAAVVFSQTAGSIIALAGILALIFLHERKKPIFPFTRGLFLFHATLVLFLVFFADLSGKKESIAERFFKWKVGFEIVRKNPVLGVGIGGVKTNFAVYQAGVRRDFKLKSTSESKIHNEFIQIAAETGIAGFLSFVFLLFSAAFYLSKRDFYAHLTVVAFALDSMTNFPLHLPASSIVFAAALSSFEDSEKSFGPLPVLIISGVLAVVFVREFLADRFRFVGYGYYKSGFYQKAVEYLEKANRLSPASGKICYFLGMACVKLKDYDGAVKAFGNSVKIRNYGEVFNDLGNAYYLKGDYGSAVSNWRRAVALGVDGEGAVIKNIEKLSAASHKK